MTKKNIIAGSPDLEPRFNPWVGSQYQDDLDREAADRLAVRPILRVLVLGEAIYARPGDPDAWVDHPGVVHDAINDWAISAERSSATYTRVANLAAVALDMPPGKEVWRHIAFAEFVQSLVTGGPRVAPTCEQWEDGRRRFFSLLAQLRPDLTIVLGGRLWDQLPEGVGAATPPMQLYDGALVTKAWVYPYIVGEHAHSTLAVRVTHPAAPYGRWDPDEAAQIVKTARFYLSNMVDYFANAYQGVGPKPFWEEAPLADMTGAEATFINRLDDNS